MIATAFVFLVVWAVGATIAVMLTAENRNYWKAIAAREKSLRQSTNEERANLAIEVNELTRKQVSSLKEVADLRKRVYQAEDKLLSQTGHLRDRDQLIEHLKTVDNHACEELKRRIAEVCGLNTTDHFADS